MQVYRDGGLDEILHGLYKVRDNVLGKIKEIVEKPSKYVKDKVKKYEELTGSTPSRILYKVRNNIKSGFEKAKGKIREFSEYLDEILREIKDGISEYMPIIRDAALKSLPYTPKVLISSGLSVKNTFRGLSGKAVGYLLIVAGAASFGLFILSGIHGLPSPNNEHVQYLGSPDGYQGFVPKGVINYDGRTDPVGNLILDNGNVIHNAIYDGKYSDTIIQNHNQIVKLNNDFVGKINPVNKQPYVPLQDVYVIKGQVPIMQVTINGQTYYVIDANKINPANIAGFYTYREWVNNFVAAMNTPGTYAAGLPGNSPVFKWTNTTGTVAYQTMVYGQYGLNGAGGAVLVLPNGTIIPYGTFDNIIGSSLKNYIFVQHSYNPSS